jgi:carboxypeptidase C (cathepsin A)
MKNWLLVGIVLLFLDLSFIKSAPIEELVKGLPLYSDFYKGDIYSGYLNTMDSGRKLHYIFLPSQNNPSKDPLVLWLNGGPGCSSMLGYLMENGPVVLDDYDDKWKENKYSWNKFVNMLYIEAPAGVGFSYFTNPDDIKTDDKKTSEDNERALVNFFEKFPEFQSNDFYISGESYAGVYVPWLAKTIIQKKSKGVNLKGIIVGNGVTDMASDMDSSLVQFAYDHYLYPEETYKQYHAECGESSFSRDSKVTKACNKVRQSIKDSIQGLNIYDIYRPCPPKDLIKSPSSYQDITISSLRKIQRIQKERKHKKAIQYNQLEYLDDQDSEPSIEIWPDGCMEDLNVEFFLNNKTVKSLLHIREDLNWTQCNDYINANYTMGNASLDIYQNILIKSDLRVWFYSGDTDGAVPFTGSIKWIQKLGLNITEEYRSWTTDGQTAGFVQTYGKNFKYVTVKGTGHMVPQWKRAEAFTMFNAFVKGVELPN